MIYIIGHRQPWPIWCVGPVIYIIGHRQPWPIWCVGPVIYKDFYKYVAAQSSDYDEGYSRNTS
jgi:hypothetical protein